jgi:hypothetical protein
VDKADNFLDIKYASFGLIRIGMLCLYMLYSTNLNLNCAVTLFSCVSKVFIVALIRPEVLVL